MKKYLMKCGHVSNAITLEGEPVCVICAPDETSYLVDREILDDNDALKGRKARCSYCGKQVDSNWFLPFFHCKPNESFDEYYCGCGGWD